LGNQRGYPTFWGGLGNGAGSQNLWNMGPWHNNEELYVAKDDFSKVKGSHTFKVGFLASNNKKNELSAVAQRMRRTIGVLRPVAAATVLFDALNATAQWGFGEPQTNPFAHTRWHDYEVTPGTRGNFAVT